MIDWDLVNGIGSETHSGDTYEGRDTDRAEMPDHNIPSPLRRTYLQRKYGPQHSKPVVTAGRFSCRWCGVAGFHWKRTGEGWRLIDGYNVIHNCGAYHGNNGAVGK